MVDFGDVGAVLILLVLFGGAIALSFLGSDEDEKTSSAQKDINADTSSARSDVRKITLPSSWSGYFWVLSLLGSIGAVITLVGGLIESESAIQQGAVGAIAVAIAVIPYCAARAVSELGAK